MPAYNEARYLPGTIDALLVALERSGLDAELVVVDDGSADGSGDVARGAVRGRIPARVLRQENSGRFAARRAGVEAAEGSLVLLLDGRVRVEADALLFLSEMVQAGKLVWTSHVHVAGDSAFGAFWALIAELAWREYFDHPRTTTFGVDDFDHFPKGTTCFVAPRDDPARGVRPLRFALCRHTQRERRHAGAASHCRAVRHRGVTSFRMHVCAEGESSALREAFGSSGSRLRRRTRSARISILPGRRGVLPAQRRDRPRRSQAPARRACRGGAACSGVGRRARRASGTEPTRGPRAWFSSRRSTCSPMASACGRGWDS